MAKESLRSYNHEIEKLTDQGQYEEALAHCRYILQTYPKHLETYRLLAKVFLESERYGEAADIFMRVLTSIPDDFVSNIGMSIIREDEGDLDAAISHMELAFEVQPSNTAVQDELRRLYGRRDGLEPSRIRLTRGALVRMYVRGDLYQQAIAEARAALVENPQKTDIQILLARMCYLAGQRVDATELCSNLLTKFPYCYEANRILAEILPGTKRAEDAQIYRIRLNALDPYIAFVSADIPDPVNVPDGAVMMDKLDWLPTASSPEQPQWASTLGINTFDKITEGEKVPDWFNEPVPSAEQSSSQPAIPTIEESPSLAPQAELDTQEVIKQLDKSDEIPDWMASAGWVPSTGQAVEGQPPAGEEAYPATSEEIANGLQPAEIPDWLKDLAPKEPETALETPSEDVSKFEAIFSTATELPADLEKTDEIISPVQPPEVNAVEATSTLNAPTSGDQDAAMAWLESLAAKHGAEEETLFVKPEERTETPPAWILESTPQPVIPELTIAQTVAPTQETEAVIPPSEIAPTPEPEIAPLPVMAESAVVSAPELVEAPAAVEISPAAPELGVVEEPVAVEVSPVVPEPEAVEALAAAEVSAVVPESEPVEAPPAAEVSPAIAETSQAPEARSPETFAPSQADQDAALAWLESLAAKHGAEEETLFVKPEDRIETPPAWIQEAPVPPPVEEAPGAPTQEKITTQETIVSQVEETNPVQNEEAQALPTAGEDAAFAWLEPPAAMQNAGEETLFIKPEEHVETPPAQIAESSESAPSPAVENAPSAGQNLPAEQAGVSEWLQELETTEATPPHAQVTGETGATDLTWLHELEETAQPSIPTTQTSVEVSAQIEGIVSPPSPVPPSMPEKPGETKSRQISIEPEQLAHIINKAQADLIEGKLDSATAGYGQLIKSGQYLEETIHDLRDALYKYPVDIGLLQTLGDAYVRSNRLQDALDAYTQAEELIK